MSLKSAHTGKIGKAFINARKLRSMSQEEAASTAIMQFSQQGCLQFNILKNMQNSLI